MFRHAAFRAAVAHLGELPPEGPPELAFVGRSNVGKSSAINALTGRKRLAFVSRTPGRTQTLNFFDLGTAGRLVDLPGYGYARAPKARRSRWGALIEGYLRRRTSLAAVVLILDARLGLTARDAQLVHWLKPLGRPLLVLLAKCDRLPERGLAEALEHTREALAVAGARAELLAFSSASGEGVARARALLEAWLAHRAGRPEK